MTAHDIRWRQRAAQFAQAHALLQEALAIAAPNKIEQAGLIQFFEMSFELAWKTLKDYLEAQGFDAKSPREAIKLAFAQGLITQGEDWLNALDDRNLTSHTYSEATANLVLSHIRSRYAPRLAAFALTLAVLQNELAS